MAKKTLTIADQINALESDLESKNEELKTYEKSVDKLLKSLFGLDKKSIDKLITDSRKKTLYKAVEIPAPDEEDAEFPVEINASEGQSPSAI
jgi:hypothetical protein